MTVGQSSASFSVACSDLESPSLGFPSSQSSFWNNATDISRVTQQETSRGISTLTRLVVLVLLLFFFLSPLASRFGDFDLDFDLDFDS